MGTNILKWTAFALVISVIALAYVPDSISTQTFDGKAETQQALEYI